MLSRPSLKWTIATLLLFWLTPTTHAVVIDLSMVTCQEFLTSNRDEIRIILAWLDGYYKDEQDPPVIDTETLAASLAKLNEYCAENPTSGLLAAAERLLRK